MKFTGFSIVMSALLLSAVAHGQEKTTLPFKVRDERPRIWIRADEWEGASIPKLKKWFALPEYKERGVDSQAVLNYLVKGDVAAGKAALNGLVAARLSGGSPSYEGAEAMWIAACYDWLRNHPDFTPENRAKVVAYLEGQGEYFSKYCTERSSSFFYARYPGAIGGVTLIGLALYGDSPKAEGFIKVGHKSLLEYGRGRQYEGGSSAGGSYSIFHVFSDLARSVYAFESATDAGVLKHIREKQDNWLENQLLWQIWTTLPNGYFVKEGDIWKAADVQQMRIQVDVLTGLLKNGYGRAHADAMRARHQKGSRYGDYHSNYVWNFFVFNDPEVQPQPVENLGRTALFGRDFHGYVIFRDGWKRGDSHIFFRCGEGCDIHSNRGAGAFDIYRHEVLAQRANKDYPDRNDDDIKFCNSMVFNGHNHASAEMKPDIPLSFDAFLQAKKAGNIEWATLTDYEVTNAFARVRGDLSAAARQDCAKWTRELVYLGYKYLLILDRVKTKPIPVTQKWQIHLTGTPVLDGNTVSTVKGKGKLFCRTLLPAGAVIGNETAGKMYRHTVTVTGEGAQETDWLHVLYPTEADVAQMPETTCSRKDGKLLVKVGELSHEFTLE